jgi:hypothetical protein
VGARSNGAHAEGNHPGSGKSSRSLGYHCGEQRITRCPFHTRERFGRIHLRPHALSPLRRFVERLGLAAAQLIGLHDDLLRRIAPCAHGRHTLGQVEARGHLSGNIRERCSGDKQVKILGTLSRSCIIHVPHFIINSSSEIIFEGF